MNGSYDSAIIGERFGLGRPPTVLTRTASVAPIGFTRLRSDEALHDKARDVPAEEAWSFHVALQPATVDLWIDGRHRFAASVRPGATFLFDLRRNPVSHLHTAFDVLRFYISQASLDELAFDQGRRRSTGFARPCLGEHDPVMHGLAMALVDNVQRPNEASALFVDHIGLAFHAHVVGRYDEAAARARVGRGGLSPWQWRRAVDFMQAHLDGDPVALRRRDAPAAQDIPLRAEHGDFRFRAAGIDPDAIIHSRCFRPFATLLKPVAPFKLWQWEKR